MKKYIIAGAVALFSTSAMAADVIYADVAPAAPMELPPVASWEGFYVGAQLGWGFGSTGTLDIWPFTPGLQTAFAPGFAGEFDDGFVGGLHAGYDWQSGNFVYGLVLDVSATDISDVQSGFSVTPAAYNITRDIDFLATLRARAGFVFADNFLAYATGGVAYGDVDFGYSQPGSGAAFTTSGGQNSDFGYTVGGGLETLITPNLSIGIEYLYTDLGKNDFTATLVNGPFGGPTGAPGSNPGGTELRGSDNRFDFHTVTARISYRF